MTWPLRSHKFLFVEIQRYFTIYLIICTNTSSNLSQHPESNFDKSFLLTLPSQITSFVRNQALKILRRVHFNVHSLRKNPGCHTFSGFFRVDWPFGEIAAWFSNRRLHFYPSPSRLGSTFSRTRALAGSPRNPLALANYWIACVHCDLTIIQICPVGTAVDSRTIGHMPNVSAYGAKGCSKLGHFPRLG